jgi:hypothetical protein
MSLRTNINGIIDGSHFLLGQNYGRDATRARIVSPLLIYQQYRMYVESRLDSSSSYNKDLMKWRELYANSCTKTVRYPIRSDACFCFCFCCHVISPSR